MKHRVVLLLIVSAFLCMMILPASAGDFYEIIVAAKDHGVSVYNVPRGRSAGMLYNGYTDDNVAYLREENGWFPLELTDDYTVWVHEKTASKNLPEVVTGYNREWESRIPCSAFLGQLIEDNAVMRSKPDKQSHMIARHAAGSQFVVWGEFGAYYYVKNGRWNEGFVSKSSVLKMRDLTYQEANYWWSSTDTPCADHRKVYCEAGGIVASDSAMRISERYRDFIGNAETVDILTYLPNGWIQLKDGSFLDGRYLDPDADHSPAKTAVIMPTQILNRLNVRHSAKANASVEAKLCSGVEVEVVSETEDWAVIGLIGAADTERRYAVVNSIVGCVQKKYLAAPDEGKVPDGTVSAVITDTIPYSWGTVLAQAGESVTVIGTSDHPYDYRGGADSLLVRGENARLFWMGFKADVLEPVTYPDVSVKTTAKTALRAAPASDAESLATIRSGVKVQVLLRGEAWTMVKYQDTTGYVMSKHLKFP